MSGIEILPVDSIRLPFKNIEEILSVKNKIYFRTKNEKNFNEKIDSFGKFFSPPYEKELLGFLEGDLNFIKLKNYLFCISDSIVYKYHGKTLFDAIDSFNLIREKNIEFDNISTDGKKLYLKDKNNPRIYLVDFDLELEKKFKGNVEEMFSSNVFTYFKIKDSFIKCFNGLKLGIDSFKKCNLTNEDKIADILLENYNSDKLDLKIKLMNYNYSVFDFCGNHGIYCLTNKGDIFTSTNEGSKIYKIEYFNQNKVFSNYNKKYDFLFANNKGLVFNNGKCVGESEIGLKDIKSVTSDENFIYFLTPNEILRHKILE